MFQKLINTIKDRVMVAPLIEYVRGKNPRESGACRRMMPVKQLKRFYFNGIGRRVELRELKRYRVTIRSQDLPTSTYRRDRHQADAATQFDRATPLAGLVSVKMLGQHQRRRPKLETVRQSVGLLTLLHELRIVEKGSRVLQCGDVESVRRNGDAPTIKGQAAITGEAVSPR